jgi:hypothetical protein
LEALLLIAAVAHMIIRLLDLSLPLPFSWGGEIFLFYEDLVFWSMMISFSKVEIIKSKCFQSMQSTQSMQYLYIFICMLPFLKSTEFRTPHTTSECVCFWSQILQTIRALLPHPPLMNPIGEGEGAAWASLNICFLWPKL